MSCINLCQMESIHSEHISSLTLKNKDIMINYVTSCHLYLLLQKSYIFCLLIKIIKMKRIRHETQNLLCNFPMKIKMICA